MRPGWLLLIGATACGRLDIAEQPVGRDGAPVEADADPSAPDADPSAPDADPTAPDASGGLVPGCRASEVPGPFSADFDAGLPAWAGFFQDSPGRIAVTGGTLTIQPDRLQTPPAYWGMGPTSSGNDLRRHRVMVKVVDMLEVSSTAQAMMLWTPAPGEGFEVFQSAGRMWCVSVTSGQRTENSVIYEPAAHRWWQLRDDGGLVHCEVSADGLTWTTMTSIPTPAELASSDVELAAGLYQPESIALGTVRFDDLIDCVTP